MRAPSRGRRAKIAITSLAVALALLVVSGGDRPALAQNGPLPPGFVESLDAALAAGDSAARNAASSASIVGDPSRNHLVNSLRSRIQEASIIDVVVSAIRHNPNSTTTIVRTAVQRSPAYRDAIVYHASFAFPAFAPLIAAAASGNGASLPLPPVTISWQSLGMSPAKSYVSPFTPISTAAPSPFGASNPTPWTPAASLPAVRTKTPGGQIPAAPAPTRYDQAIAAALAPTRFAQATGGAPAAQATVSGSGGDWWPGDTPFGVSELRGGFGHHDSGVFGRNEEDGQVVMIEARFAPFTGGLWDKIWQPRPHLGVNINTEGDTSSLYIGLTWDWDIWRSAFVSFDLGGAVHDGELTTSRLDRKELGSRILFREALELGYVFGNRHALSLRLDHISNANLADQNEGLETIAFVYGYRFP